MKLYILEVPNCNSCPYSRHISEEGVDCLCFHPSFQEDYKPVRDADTMPKWCPLPNKEKEK